LKEEQTVKIVTCEVRESSTATRFLGAVVSDQVMVDLGAARDALAASGKGAQALPGDMIGFLAAGDGALATARAAFDHASSRLDANAPEKARTPDGRRLAWWRKELRLLPAVPRPGKILHTSVNFRSHKEEVASGFRAPEWQAQNWGSFHYEHPTGFLQAPSATVGTEAEVIIPRFTKQLDYELELAIVIGRHAKHVSKDEALDYVAGYCVFNDISARDIQAREHANKVILLGKSFDTSCPLGPWLTTKDEVPDPQKLKMQLRLNGELRQDANTSDMIYGVRDLVSWWSNITLEPGDVITSGAPAGVIAGRENPVWLAPGDRIEATVEGLGTLVNVIAAETRK
jgi:2-keto-4-pentenoate hydratase/2-oxohepta-3-ene-1,7-dioic acid hydratase in catechol pathway